MDRRVSGVLTSKRLSRASINFSSEDAKKQGPGVCGLSVVLSIKCQIGSGENVTFEG